MPRGGKGCSFCDGPQRLRRRDDANHASACTEPLVCGLQRADGIPRRQLMRPITANVLSTAEVRSPAGEHVGKIVDFMLDTERGAVEYAVLAVGGVLGVGAKMLAVQPGELRFDASRNCLEITVDTATLAAHPGIDRTNPPESANAAVRSRASSPRPQSTPRSER